MCLQPEHGDGVPATKGRNATAVQG